MSSSIELDRIDDASLRLVVPQARDHDIKVFGAGDGPEGVLATLEAGSESATLSWPASEGRAKLHLETGDGSTVVAERALGLEGVTNARDLGGYRAEGGKTIKWGQLFRSANLSTATDGDLAQLRSEGLRFVVDFRKVEEVETEPDRLPGEDTHFINAAIGQHDLNAADIAEMKSGSQEWFDGGGMTRIYLSWIAYCAPLWAGLMNRIAEDEDYPALFHCMAGKDRTGAFVALLLNLLGVSDEDVVRDHQLTNKAMEALRAEAATRKERDNDVLGGLLPTYTSPPETVQSLLNKIREDFGSVEAFLIREGGLKHETPEKLRSAFLEDAFLS